jgi:hypothetical protein
MVNMQLAMYQMLTNSSSTSTNALEYNSAYRVRSIDESNVTNYHLSLKNYQKPLKRLIHKRQRLEKNLTTSK